MKKNILLTITLGLTLGTGFAAPKPQAEASRVLEAFEKAVTIAEDFTNGDSLKLDAPLDGQSAGTGWQGSWAGNQSFIVSSLVKKGGGDKLPFPAGATITTPGARKGNSGLTIQRQLKSPIPKATETWVEFYLFAAGRTNVGIGLLNSEGQLMVGVSKDHGVFEETQGQKISGYIRLFDENGPDGQNVSPAEDKALAIGFRWHKVLLRIKGDGKGQAKAEAWINPDANTPISEPACTLEFAESSDIAFVQLRAADFYDNVPGDVQIAGLTIKTLR